MRIAPHQRGLLDAESRNNRNYCVPGHKFHCLINLDASFFL